jgi:GTP-binding protein HflX
VFVSAKTGSGLEGLLERIGQAADAGSLAMRLRIPFAKGAMLRLAHEQCSVLSEEHDADGTVLRLRVPRPLESRFNEYII